MERIRSLKLSNLDIDAPGDEAETPEEYWMAAFVAPRMIWWEFSVYHAYRARIGYGG